jgi:hypothetical protein
MSGQRQACSRCLKPRGSQGSDVPVRSGQEVLIMVRLLCWESKNGMQVVAYMFLVIPCSMFSTFFWKNRMQSHRCCHSDTDVLWWCWPAIVVLTCYSGNEKWFGWGWVRNVSCQVLLSFENMFFWGDETRPCVVEYSVSLLSCGLACYRGSFWCCCGAWFGVAIASFTYVWSIDVPDLVCWKHT